MKIPAALDEYPLKAIMCEAFMDCMDLTSVTLPLCVKAIGPEAFAYCESLTSITIPPHVEKVWCKAFDGCAGLKSVVFEEAPPETRANESKFPEGVIGSYRLEHADKWKKVISIDGTWRGLKMEILAPAE